MWIDLTREIEARFAALQVPTVPTYNDEAGKRWKGFHQHSFLNTVRVSTDGSRPGQTEEERTVRRTELERKRKVYKAAKAKRPGNKRGPKTQGRKPKCHPDRPHYGGDLCKSCFYYMTRNISKWQESAKNICIGRDLKPSQWREILTNPTSAEEIEAFTDFVYFLVKCRKCTLAETAVMLQTNEAEVRSALANRG